MQAGAGGCRLGENTGGRSTPCNVQGALKEKSEGGGGSGSCLFLSSPEPQKQRDFFPSARTKKQKEMRRRFFLKENKDKDQKPKKEPGEKRPTDFDSLIFFFKCPF
jgi:hypothetical protein